MHACVREGECESAGTLDARFEEEGLGYSHMHTHTHTCQTKKRQAPGGWGSPQERVLAHRGGRNWALSARWASSLFTWISLCGYVCCHSISSFISPDSSFKSSTCLTFSSVCISQSVTTIWVVVAQADYNFEFTFMLRLAKLQMSASFLYLLASWKYPHASAVRRMNAQTVEIGVMRHRRAGVKHDELWAPGRSVWFYTWRKSRLTQHDSSLHSEHKPNRCSIFRVKKFIDLGGLLFIVDDRRCSDISYSTSMCAILFIIYLFSPAG